MGGTDLTVLVVDDDFRVANMHAGIVEAMLCSPYSRPPTPWWPHVRPPRSIWRWSTFICRTAPASTSFANCVATAWF